MKYTLLFVHEKDAHLRDVAPQPITLLPDEHHPNYEDVLKRIIIEAKVKQLSDMSLSQLIRHFGVEVKPHQDSQVVKRLEINNL